MLQDSLQASNDALSVRDLCVDIAKERGTQPIVRNVSLEVRQGETVCVVGESGCGKSMTAMALMSLLPRAARVKFDHYMLKGQTLAGLSHRQMSDVRGRQIGMIFQEPMTSLNPCLTIGTQLKEPFLRHKLGNDAQATEQAVSLLGRTGIRDAAARMKQYPHELSGGLRQRVMIAMSLMCKPSFVIADEPTTALDVTIQAQIIRLLKELQVENNIGLLLITHDLGLVANIADRVVVLYAGEVVEQGSVSDVIRHPKHPYTRALIDCLIVPGQTKPGELLKTIPGSVPSGFRGDRCGFLNRCPHATDACHRPIALRPSYELGHLYRCVLEA